MPPRQESVVSNGEKSNSAASSSSSQQEIRGTTTRSNNGNAVVNDGSTVIVRPHPGKPAYVHCQSKGDFINPFPHGYLPAAAKNERLNLNLGQTILTHENTKLLRWIIKLWSSLCVEWWEALFFFVYAQKVPLTWRRALTFTAWKIYFPLHKALLGRRTGLHADASDEYHALTTIMWWGRFFPVSVRRMRFSLSQLHVVSPCVVPFKRARPVLQHDMVEFLNVKEIPQSQKDHVTVNGLFLRVDNQKPSEWTIFWVYGGAFLSGDVVGNSGPADYIGKACGMDVFLPSFRLAPEYRADDIVWDICLAYRWLCQRRNPSKILLLGISSGGALCTMLMQNLAKLARGETNTLIPAFVEPALRGLPMPSGCTLFGPFVDLTEPSGALLHYQKHDLIVNQSVLDVGVPYLDTHIPNRDRKGYSPIYQSCQGLPPLCIAVSEHETTYDMTVQLINRARRDGVQVSVGVWRYMCHVFSFLNAFVPEGQQSMEFCIEWMRQQANKGDKKDL